MQFAVGDKVIHPGLGAGQIAGVKHQELVKGFAHYYVIEITEASGQESTVYVPMRKMEEVGVRPIMSRAKLAGVLDTLQSTPCRLPRSYKTRQAQVREKLGSGLPTLIAEVVRDLSWHAQVAYLTRHDSELLERARHLLSSEMALVTNEEVAAANQIIKDALAVAATRREPATVNA